MYEEIKAVFYPLWVLLAFCNGLLMEKLWPDGTEYVEENALSVTVRRLRGKLEADPANPKYLKTVYGLGYTWVVQP